MIAKKEQDRVQSIKKKFEIQSGLWRDIRKSALDDLKFLTGEMYDEVQARAAVAQGGAPMIQNNRLHTLTQQVENELRALNISLCVHATDEMGSEYTAEVIQGLFRHIENISNAPNAYISAVGKTGALIPGFGVVKIATDYVKPDSFDQDIYIREVKDPFSVVPDYNAKKSDFSDAEFIFEFRDIDKDEFEEMYPDAELTTRNWDIIGNKFRGTEWLTKTQVRIVRYWYKDKTYSTLTLYEDGTTNDDHETNPAMEESYEPIPPEYQTEESGTHNVVVTAKKVKQTRKVEHCVVKWIETNGYEILKEGEWHNGDLPFVFFVGTDMIVDGKRDIHGIIRYAKDSQKMYNYLSSQIITKIASASRAPWIAPTSAIPDELRPQWEGANVNNPAVLYYRDRDEQGNPITPPTRGDNVEPAIQSLLAAGQKSTEDMKAALGIFDAGDLFGMNGGNEQKIAGAGVALKTLAAKGKDANAHFSNNYVLGIKSLGEKIINLIPEIYDTERVVRIIGVDDEPELVTINSVVKSGKYKGKVIDLENCKDCYGVVVDTGQSFANKRTEQVEEMMDFVQVYPQSMPVVADLIAKASDWDNSHAFAERIMKWQASQFPWLTDQEGMEGWPPEAKAAVAKSQQDIQQLQQHLAMTSQEYNKVKAQHDSNIVDNQGKIALEQLKANTALELKKMELAQTEMEMKLQAFNDDVRLRLEHIQHGKDIAAKHVINETKVAANQAAKTPPATPES